MGNEHILKWIGRYLKGEIDDFVFTCLMVLNHVVKDDDIPGNLRSNLVLAIDYLQSGKHLDKKDKQQMDRCLADILKVPLCDKAELEVACETAMEKTAEIITLFSKNKEETE
jgi:uncharacterized protein (UPF0147 family)